MYFLLFYFSLAQLSEGFRGLFRTLDGPMSSLGGVTHSSDLCYQTLSYFASLRYLELVQIQDFWHKMVTDRPKETFLAL